MQGKHPLFQEKGYLAWIPCVSGRLSLKHISTNQIHKNHVYCPTVHAVVEGLRHTACFFETNTEDFRVKGAHGNWYAIVALEEIQTNPSVFKGKIFWWLKDKNYSKWTIFKNRNPELKLFPPLFNMLANLQKTASDDVASWRSRWANIIKSASAHEGQFKLEVEFKLKDDGLIWLSKTARTHKGQRSELDLDQDKTAVRQSFYMIKQCLHLHKHHEVSDDALTTAHSTEEMLHNSPNDPGVALVNDLKVSLIDFHRMIYGKYSMLNKVSGIAAYANSLIQTLVKNQLITSEEGKRQEIFFDNIKASISTTADSLEFQSNEKVARSENRRNLTLLFLAILSPQVLLYRHFLINEVSTSTPIYKLLSGTVPHLEFWIILLIFYIVWPHVRFTARAKDFLMNSRIWGWTLRKVWRHTSALQHWILSSSTIVTGLSITALGVYYYIKQTGILP